MKNDLYQQNFKIFSFLSGFEFQTGLRLQKHLYAVPNLISYAWITQNESSTDEKNQKLFLQKITFLSSKSSIGVYACEEVHDGNFEKNCFSAAENMFLR